jgi:hypothetical protein
MRGIVVDERWGGKSCGTFCGDPGAIDEQEGVTAGNDFSPGKLAHMSGRKRLTNPTLKIAEGSI